ncbi:pheromone A receptor-domain-containing protein [Russula emetica]|nr:pheromone A receptor-domain-containing protein [Russula emetica]
MMYPPPNELYSAFSFFGFVLCAIPFYWHFKARNMGTCLFMFWTGLGCLIQCINSIVWNKNMVNRAPVYCDISTRIQVALNVAVPACSLCINRQLYRVARMKSAGTTDAENRRIVIIDLLIGVGIPVLQMIVQYVISIHRYTIFEDFGPAFSNALMLPTFFLFNTWPLAIGIVSLFYCVVNIYTFYKRESQCRQMMSSTFGFSRSRYLRLIAISSVEVFATIPLATVIIAIDAKRGIKPWKSWADTHSHYSVIFQIAGFTWKNIPEVAMSLELYRWLLVLSALLFFALFGFAVEAREHYYRLYKSLARCVGYSMSTGTPHGAPHAAPPVPHVKRNELGSVTVTVPIKVPTGRHKDSLSLTDQSSMLSISTTSSTPNPNSTTDQASLSETVSFYHSAKSFDDLEMLGQSSPPAGILLTAPPTSVPPHFSDASESTMPVHASSSVETV